MARDLPQLREKIDQIDAAIVALLAQRMEVCREVAEVKAGSSTAVIQPQRVREVLTTRRQWAINSGVDADFAEQIFRTLLAETHRIEVAHERGGVAPTKVADTLLSALDTVAVRIDHVVVAVVVSSQSKREMMLLSIINITKKKDFRCDFNRIILF